MDQQRAAAAISLHVERRLGELALSEREMKRELNLEYSRNSLKVVLERFVDQFMIPFDCSPIIGLNPILTVR